MYVRVAEITSQSSLQFKMLMAFIENEFLPRNIKAGQLSGEIFRTSDNSCFVISRFTSKAEANKIMSIMKTELEEMRGSNIYNNGTGQGLIFYRNRSINQCFSFRFCIMF